MGEERSASVTEDQDEGLGHDPDPQFEPIVNLLPVQTKTLEEDEEEMLKLRAKMFRYDTSADPREWKERGTGDVKILRHKQTSVCRLLMRRDKTLKICANHYILPHFELKPNCGSDRAWVWATPADFADEEPKEEQLAVRFANSDQAQEFKKIFDEAKSIMAKRMEKAKPEKSSSASKSDDAGAAAPSEGAGKNEATGLSNGTTEESKESADVSKVIAEVEKLSVTEDASKTTESKQ